MTVMLIGSSSGIVEEGREEASEASGFVVEEGLKTKETEVSKLTPHFEERRNEKNRSWDESLRR